MKTNWPVKKLNEVATIQKGKMMPNFDGKEENSMPYIVIGDLRTGGYSRYTDEDNGVLCKFTDSLIVWDGANAGTVGGGLEGFVGSTIAKISSKDIIIPKLLKYLLQSKFLEFNTETHGAAIPHLNKDFVYNLAIPVPPIKIQQKIVERLDAIRKAQELNDLQISKTQELFRSFLYTEVESRNDYPSKMLGEVAVFLDSKRKPVTKKDRVPGPYPYYGANGQQDSVSDYIFDDELVLLAEDGGNFGSKTRPVAYRISGKCWVNNHAHVIKVRETVLTDYLGYSLMYYDVTPFISGSTRAKLNKTQAEKIVLNIPDLVKQQKIVEKLNAVQNYKKSLFSQKSLLKELFDSVLHKSINGEMDT